MSIPDKAVEALVEVMKDRQVQRPVGRHLSDIARAGLEAAEPYLTGDKHEALVEARLAIYEMTKFVRSEVPTASGTLKELRRVHKVIDDALHPEVKS